MSGQSPEVIVLLLKNLGRLFWDTSDYWTVREEGISEDSLFLAFIPMPNLLSS